MTKPTQVRVFNNSQYPIVLTGRSGDAGFHHVVLMGDNQTMPAGSADDGSMASASDGDFFMTLDVEGIDYQPGLVDDALKPFKFSFQATNPSFGTAYFQVFDPDESGSNDSRLWTMLEDAKYYDPSGEWVTGDLVTNYPVYANNANAEAGNNTTNKAYFAFKNNTPIPQSGGSQEFLGFQNPNDWYEYFELSPYFKVQYNEATSKAFGIEKWDFYVDNIDSLDITPQSLAKYIHQSAVAKDPILHHLSNHFNISGIDQSGIALTAGL